MSIWANLLHVSYNMWSDRPDPQTPTAYSDSLQCDDGLWAELTQRMADSGFTMVVLDLGDAVRYESHPEIAVAGAWSTQRLREELGRLRGLGLEPVPKLNFAAGHDAWLGEYARQVSTPTYYRVCGELVAEVAALFDRPRLFHIGMDEETAHHQRRHAYVVVRQHDLWWHDLEYLAGRVTAAGSRPWVWSDQAWRHAEDFYLRMPRSILQSNWYYGEVFDGLAETGRPRDLDRDEYALTYLDLDDHGYDQIPTGSNWTNPQNFERTVEFCRRRLAPERLSGFLQAPWHPTLPAFRDHHLAAIDQVARAVQAADRAV